MPSGPRAREYDRVVVRRRAVALARRRREVEGFSIAQIADRLGRSSATVKAYFHDPTGGEGPRGQGQVRGRVSGPRRLHTASLRQGRRTGTATRAIPGRSSGAGLGMGSWRDGRLARALRPCAIVLRLVEDVRAPARGRGAAALGPRLLAVGERRHRCVGELVGGAQCDWCSVEQGRAAV
jgi:hypothetical protein